MFVIIIHIKNCDDIIIKIDVRVCVKLYICIPIDVIPKSRVLADEGSKPLAVATSEGFCSIAYELVIWDLGI